MCTQRYRWFCVLFLGFVGCGAEPQIWTPRDAASETGASLSSGVGDDGGADVSRGLTPTVDAPGATLPPNDGPPAAADGVVDAPLATSAVDAPVGAMPADGPNAGLTPDTATVTPPLKTANGKACVSGGACQSGICTEGICCDVACGGKCSSCLMKNTGTADGTCATTRAGIDPRNNCDKNEASACGQDGECDGTGECRLAATQAVCGAESCVSGTYAPVAHCDGKGGCARPASVSCGNYPCSGNRCKMTCAGSSECPGSFFCAQSLCVPKNTNGAACGGAGECTSGNCVEGVCCDGACGATCYSCRKANTDRPDGQCSAVTAGTAPRNDCGAPSAVATCGRDGKCDGTGACRLYAAATMCVAETCTAGVHTPARRCDGQGTCTAQPTNACGVYTCGPSACRISCGDHGDCVATHYCAAGTCKVRDQNGAVCALNQQCQSGICGGRCCAAECKCSVQSSGNLIANGGFDKDAEGWSAIGTTAYWIPAEKTACPYSGAFAVGDYVPLGSSCVPVQAGIVYNVGGDYLNTDTTYSASCLIYFSMGTDCGDVLSWIRVSALATTTPNIWWSFSMAATVPPDARSATLECSNGSLGWFDNMYFTPAPGRF